MKKKTGNYGPFIEKKCSVETVPEEDFNTIYK